MWWSPAGDVSRRHAEIQVGAEGYVLSGPQRQRHLRNGKRVGKSHRLSRADVIRIGTDEFRFYADAAPEPAPPMAPRPVPSEGAAPHPHRRQSPALRHHARRAPRAPSRFHPHAHRSARGRCRSPRSWSGAGTCAGGACRSPLPVVNIGRADYNDIVIADPSVSTTHAKLQRQGRRLGADRPGLHQRHLRRGGAGHRGDRRSRRGPPSGSATCRRCSSPTMSRTRPAAGPRHPAGGARFRLRAGRCRAVGAASGRAAADPRRGRAEAEPACRPGSSSLAGGRRRRHRLRAPDLELTGPRAFHLCRSDRRRDRPVGQRRQLPHAGRPRCVHRGGRDGWACGRRGGERDGGPDHLARDRLAARPVRCRGERPDADRDPHRERRDLRADALGARQAGHGDDGDGARPHAPPVPDRPGGRQPGLPAPPRPAAPAHQGPLLRPGAGGCRAPHARPGPGPPLQQRDHPLRRCQRRRGARHLFRLAWSRATSC